MTTPAELASTAHARINALYEIGTLSMRDVLRLAVTQAQATCERHRPYVIAARTADCVKYHGWDGQWWCIEECFEKATLCTSHGFDHTRCPDYTAARDLLTKAAEL